MYNVFKQLTKRDQRIKYILRACVCALFLAVMLCVCGNAEPRTCPYDIHLSITYNLLSEPERALFDNMYV